MGIWARVEGNLTKNPEGRIVKVDGENRQIVEIRVFADVSRLVGDQWEQDDTKSTGVDVTIWQEKLGQAVLDLYKRGARVVVEGNLHLNEYTDAEGVHHAGLRISADSVALLPYRVEAITFAAKREREAA
jgi:single-strand DNA-binding protein